jgi:hypothetical protein
LPFLIVVGAPSQLAKHVSFSYTVDSDHKIIHLVGRGASTTIELKEIRDQIMRDPLFDRTFHVLVELDHIVPHAVDFGTLVELAKVRENVPGRRMAVVAAEPVTYGLAKVYEAFGRAHGVRIFRVKKAAEVWLNAARALASESGSAV